MNGLNISKDIIPVGEFKAGLSKWLKSVRETNHPLIITQNGRPAGVLLSPTEYDELVAVRSFIQSVERGIADAGSNKVYSTQELREELINHRGNRNNASEVDSRSTR